MLKNTTRDAVSRPIAITIAAVGAVVGGFATLWLAATFRLSNTTASNLVRAYEIGGWALTIALMVFSAGTAAALLAAIRYYITRKTRVALIL